MDKPAEPLKRACTTYPKVVFEMEPEFTVPDDVVAAPIVRACKTYPKVVFEWEDDELAKQPTKVSLEICIKHDAGNSELNAALELFKEPNSPEQLLNALKGIVDSGAITSLTTRMG